MVAIIWNEKVVGVPEQKQSVVCVTRHLIGSSLRSVWNQRDGH